MEKRIVLASHGGLAAGLADTAHMILGPAADVLEVYGLEPGGDAADYAAQLEGKIAAAPDTAFFILTDIYGASVCRAMLPLAAHENVRLLTGMNLPMVIELLDSDGDLLCAGFAEALRGEAARGVRLLEALKPDSVPEEDF